MSIQEHVILVTTGNGDWHSGKICRTRYTPLHLAFSSWLLTQRRMSDHPARLNQKSLGVWTNSVCGHPQSGEETGDNPPLPL
jgi:isopentenyl-diphosphate delta-isomerase